ncbi:unnamed protein product [Arabis nemorensis]|uniref:RING-type domain-containing protein n=1 Tax=Arabis nemorensis TaxID=586526 RepID=A0A565CGJ3_9BRAS|nr:unnamed protein product [Arabis nemorensis]
MAIQAQHPSFFFLNSNGQETINDWSLQPQDTHFTFIKAEVVGSRKRSREVSSVDFIEFSAAPMNPPPQKPPQVISTVVSTHEQSQNREKLLSTFYMLPGDLAGEIKRQRDDLDRLLQTQGEELRRMLAGNRESRYVELLCATEDLVGRRMREKEAELEKAMRRHAELEARAAQLASEAQTWQVRATTLEAEVSSLQTHIHQAVTSRATLAKRHMIGCSNINGNEDEAEDTESIYVDPKRIELIGPSCRICCRKSATVMALPCRHLVVCKGCNNTMRVCPICLNEKNSSVEIFFS